MLRSHKINELNESLAGEKVSLCGWVDTFREHGNVLFVDLRDKFGKVQCVVSKKGCEDFAEAKKSTVESCVKIYGEVKKRPEGSENKDLGDSGKVEISVEKYEILNLCLPIPFEVNDSEVNEDTRLKYRFLDLRSDKMQNNLLLRSKILNAFRSYFNKNGFVDVETPLLGKSTPEGARDYVVPARNFQGKFYALPQSPQILKQLLMVGGTDKYFQIAKCLRDEDLRSDRQPEFTQLDVEMSFVDEEDVFKTVEDSINFTLKEALGKDLDVPFKRMTYKEVMEKYGSDKPDLRKNKDDSEELAFLWVTDFPMFEKREEDGKMVAAHHPFCMPDDLEALDKDPLKINARSYDLVLNGVELLSGSIRVHKPAIQKKIFQILELSEEEIEEKFGFMLKALGYGAPPHAGFAIGIDRLLQILLNQESIREVIAFPKNKEAKDVMLDAPSVIDEKQLKDLSIEISKKKEE